MEYNELVTRSKKDQEMRNNALEGGNWDESIDRDNTEYLRGLINAHGWPALSSSGYEVCQAAWLIAQHADHDPAFQVHCLELMKALPDNEVNKINMAYLEDRVRVNHGEAQLYGSQFYEEGDFFGPRPIENSDKVDERRQAVGLEPFKDYEARMREIQSNRSPK